MPLQRGVALVFAYLVAALGLIGLLAGEQQLLGFLNVDWPLDVARLALAALLFSALYWARDSISVRTALGIFGVVYLGLALIGMISPTVGGLLPSRLSGFDIAFHLLAGIVAVAVAAMPAEVADRSSATSRDTAGAFYERLPNDRNRRR
jgi:hypothetical protein